VPQRWVPERWVPERWVPERWVPERWVMVSGFTQTHTAWRPVRVEGERLLRGAPRAATFVEAAHLLEAPRASGAPEPTTYVGYSQGGRLCLQLALDRPDAVQRLVLVSASPGIADAEARAARVDADEHLAQEIERDGIDAFLERWLAQPLFATLPRERSGIEERRKANTVDWLTYQLRVLGQGVQPSNWPRLGELAMPVLLIVGELDTKYVGIVHEMAEAIPEARVEIVAGAGHACHLEQPDVVAHLLASWRGSA
jgi:2-succinyl-6-hydroxy-2,4-cyclohexadiene-1-carboxylate synthase